MAAIPGTVQARLRVGGAAPRRRLRVGNDVTLVATTTDDMTGTPVVPLGTEIRILRPDRIEIVAPPGLLLPGDPGVLTLHWTLTLRGTWTFVFRSREPTPASDRLTIDAL